MKALNVLLALLVSLLTTLVVAELGLRLIGRGPKLTVNQPDPDTGWSKRTDFRFQRKTSEFDVWIETNALGLRDDPMSTPAKPAGSYRVICLGDSFVLGYAVPRNHLFVDQLEEWWHAEGRDIEVLNVGTEAWSTDQEAAWLDRYGADYRPDLVLLFPYENDIWWNGESEYRGTPKPRYSPAGVLEKEHVVERPRTVLERTAIGKLFHPTPAAQTISLGSKQILADFGPLLIDPPAGVAEAEARTRGALSALARRSEALGARLVVVPIPSHSAIDPAYRDTSFGPAFLPGIAASAWSPDRPVELFLAQAQELGLATIDPRAGLKAAAASAGEPLYYQHDFHLNARGNLELTKILKASLDGMGVLPADRQAKTSLAAAPVLPDPPAPKPRWPWVFATLWTVLSISYSLFYKDEKPPLVFVKVGLLLAAIFTIAIGGSRLLAMLPPNLAPLIGIGFVVAILGFVAYKLGARLATILELFRTFTLRGHWYLMPLVMILLTIGSLLVVAASSPLVAPFIYTLF